MENNRFTRRESLALMRSFAHIAYGSGLLTQWEWQQLNAAGLYVTSNPANAFFYVLTAIHGVHLLGGLWVWGRTTGRVLTGADVERVRMSVELCTVYWHYLLLVWIVLFALLLST